MIARAIAAHDNAKPPHTVAEAIDARQDNADRRNLSDRHRADLKSRLELPSEVTKTNRRRTCDIPPCAVAWLKPLAGLPESLLGPTEGEYRKHLAAAAEAAGITWEENLLRHSFGTYRLAVSKNAATVAEEMGNSAGVVRTHYTNVAGPAEAAAYCRVTPSRQSKSVLLPFVAKPKAG